MKEKGFNMMRTEGEIRKKIEFLKEQAEETNDEIRKFRLESDIVTLEWVLEG